MAVMASNLPLIAKLLEQVPDSDLSEDDTCSTHASEADRAGGYGFDFDSLPDESSDWGSFSRSSSSFSAEEADMYADRRSTGWGFDFDDLPPLPDTLTEPCRSCLDNEVTARDGTGTRPLDSLPRQTRASISNPNPPSAGYRIAVVLNGSQGDLQPLVALAKQLELFRHTVQIFTTANLVPFCHARGLDAVPAFADSQAVIKGLGGMVKDLHEGMKEGAACSEVWISEHKSAVVNLEESLDEFKPDVLLCGVQAMIVSFKYEKKTGVLTVPVYLSWEGYHMFRDYAFIEPPRPAVIAVSTFLDAVEEVRSEVRSGAICTEELVLYEAPTDLELQDGGRLGHLRRFLCAGPPPIAIGWGSMIPKGMTPSAMLGLALRTLKTLGERGVVLGGFAELDELAEKLKQGRLNELGSDAHELAEFAATDVCFVDFVSHEWLYPRCRLIVQHGGVGTWQAAIRAGKPTVVTPIYGDQYTHAARTEKMGLGVGFKKELSRVTHQELANAIIVAEARTSACDAIGKKMRAKVGERDAAAGLDNYLRHRKEERAPQGVQRPAKRISGTLHQRHSERDRIKGGTSCGLARLSKRHLNRLDAPRPSVP